MRIKDMFPIMEAPLPDSWDKKTFKGREFDRMIEYAKAHAQRVGKGSSRMAFEVPYQGRKTILKIAMNAKGVAQNMQEAEFLDDYYLAKTGLAIPMIDYDKANGRKPTWIHTEFAFRANDNSLKRVFEGVHIQDIIAYMDTIINGPYKKQVDFEEKLQRKHGQNIIDRLNDNEYYQGLFDVSQNFNGILNFADFTQSRNWGFYKRNPVIIDVGFSSEVQKVHYSNRARDDIGTYDYTSYGD